MQLEYPSYVYFIEAVGRDLVKIGVSGNPYVRVSHLRSRFKWEMRLLGAFPGEFFEEARTHRNFTASGARVFGEWYRYSLVRGDIEHLLSQQPYRLPRKLSRDEIVLRAKLRWSELEDEKFEALQILRAKENPEFAHVEVEELRRMIDRERGLSATAKVFSKFIWPRPEPEPED